MPRYYNSKRESFLKNLPTISIETSQIEKRCKFNFSYFDNSQAAGQDFSDWARNTGSASLESLLKKLSNFSKEALKYWENERAGAGSLKVLEIYGEFPKCSDFKHPIHVPQDVMWSRFRLGNKVRIIGFTIPAEMSGIISDCGKFYFDSNTFYLVFLDKNHKFFKTEKE